jgi:RecB family exonuclease
MKIPCPVSETIVPAMLSPSQISLEGGCLLKGVLGSSRNGLSRLIPHPKAELGNVIHKLMEMAVRGLIHSDGDPYDAVSETFATLLEQTRARLISDPRNLSYSDLRTTMSPLEWRRMLRFSADMAVRLMGTTQGHAQDWGGPELSYPDLPDNGRWSEVGITVPQLRLAGRMDLVEKNGRDVAIRDLKTGRVADENGAVLIHIQSQMWLYGLMVAHLDPTKRISLFVEQEEEYRIPFGDRIIAEAEVRLQETLALLPASGNIRAIDISSVGTACLYCAFRHHCGDYRSAAPGFWGGIADFRLPMDIWGEVVSMRTHGLSLMDDAGRPAKVFGLRDEHFQHMEVGKRVWMFGLASDRARIGGGKWRHPLNFYEIGDGGDVPKAWALQVFLE